MNWMTVLQIIGTMLAAGGAFGMILAGWGRFVEGRAAAKRDAGGEELTAMKILQTKVETLTTEVERLTTKVNELETTLEQESEAKKQFQAQLLLRNPEMEKTFEMIKIYIASNAPLLEKIKGEVLPTVAKLDKFLDGQVLISN